MHRLRWYSYRFKNSSGEPVLLKNLLSKDSWDHCDRNLASEPESSPCMSVTVHFSGITLDFLIQFPIKMVEIPTKPWETEHTVCWTFPQHLALGLGWSNKNTKAVSTPTWERQTKPRRGIRGQSLLLSLMVKCSYDNFDFTKLGFGHSLQVFPYCILD